MTQQRGKSVNPSHTAINLHRETLGTDCANTKQLFFLFFFPAVPVLVHVGKEVGDSG